MEIKKLKIGFDIHGVLTDAPKLFLALNSALYDAGHEIHILTGSQETSEIHKQLKELGIRWHKFFSITDYHIEQGTKVDFKGDLPYIDPEIWDTTKAGYCKRECIDLHFDDSMEYVKYFTTPYAKIWTKNNHGKNK